MPGPEKRRRAVEPYSTTPMTAAQVVRHLGHPTRQCLERWLAADPRHAGHMAKPIILMETKTKAIELVLDGMRGSRPPNGSARTSERSTTGSRRIARAAWPRCGPGTGTPARPTSLRRDEAGMPGPSAMTWRRCAAGRGAGTGERVDEGGGGGRRKRPGRRPAAPVEQGEDAAGRPSEAGDSPGSMTCLPGIAPSSHLLPPRQARQQDARQGCGDAAGGSASLGAFRPRLPLPVARTATA